QVIVQRLFAAVAAWHRQITRENIVKRRNIGRSLNGSMASQRENAAAGPADIAKQKLQNGRCANDLDSFGMLRPTDRITDGGCFLRTRCAHERICNLAKKLRWNT